MQVIKKPVYSEKSLQDASEGKYTFVVDLKADKNAISRAVSEAFGVEVVDVKTRIVKGKRVRIRGTARQRKGPSIKKATVKLASGQKITAFDLG